MTGIALQLLQTLISGFNWQSRSHMLHGAPISDTVLLDTRSDIKVFLSLYGTKCYFALVPSLSSLCHSIATGSGPSGGAAIPPKAVSELPVILKITRWTLDRMLLSSYLDLHVPSSMDMACL